MNLENTEPEIGLDTGWELFLFLFNNDCIILTLVTTGWESELRINGAVLILQKYKSTFMPKKASSYHIWMTSGEQCLGELYFLHSVVLLSVPLTAVLTRPNI